MSAISRHSLFLGQVRDGAVFEQLFEQFFLAISEIYHPKIVEGTTLHLNLCLAEPCKRDELCRLHSNCLLLLVRLA